MTLTTPQLSTIKQRAVKGAFWTSVEIVFRFGFQFGISVVLARLLTPEEFGIVALAYVFSGLAGVLIESGFSTALVQQRDLDEKEVSAIFHFQWLLALLVGCGLCLASPWIAEFCGYPVLRPLIWLLALTLVVTTLGGVHASILSRNLEFRLLAIAGLASTGIGGALAVVLALQGLGVWALALQALVTGTVFVGLLWLYCPWRPQMVFRPQLLKRSFRFGGFVFLIGLSDAIYGRLYWLAIGKIYGAADLAQYNRAEAIHGVPLSMLTGFVIRLAFPAFSALQDHQQRLTTGLRKAVTCVMVANAPTMLGLFAVAEPFVLTFFGDAWRPSVPLLQIMCLAGLVWPLHVTNARLLLALGHSRRSFQIEIAKKSIGTGCTLAALPFGLEALAYSQLVTGILGFAIQAHFTKRLLGYGALAQLRDSLPWLVAGGLMACSVWLLHFVLPVSAPLALTVQVLFGVILYLGFWLIWDFPLLREIVASLLPGRRLVSN